MMPSRPAYMQEDAFLNAFCYWFNQAVAHYVTSWCLQVEAPEVSDSDSIDMFEKVDSLLTYYCLATDLAFTKMNFNIV